jgi:peptidoglycan/xylan/chitin deacetylase (PgdA/CDA1 family)
MKRGCITLVFDDGYEHIFSRVVPLLAKYKLHGVFAIPLNADQIAHETGYPMRPWSQWVTLRDTGHEIAAHSVRHVDLTTLAEPQLLAELREPHQKLGATTLVYPGGAHNDMVVTETKKYYTAARTVRYGFEQLPPADPWRLKTVNFTRDNFTVLRANALAAWAWLTSKWLIETYHVVDSPAHLTHAIPLTEFERHLRFISSLPITNKTITEALRS